MRDAVLRIGLLWVALGGAAHLAVAAEPNQVDVFRAGEDGYHTYRIPSVIASPKGDLLAFCEARKDGKGDSGDIDLVMKRSRDGGASWLPMVVLLDFGPDTIGNPCPVFDRETGVLWMLLTHNLGGDGGTKLHEGKGQGTRTVWVMHSRDDGETWSKPIDITATTKLPTWGWYATGPGVSIQLRSGRLLVPCDHTETGTAARRSHVIASDDHGATWTIGGVVEGDANECQAVELAGGSVLLNMRNGVREPGRGRLVSESRDGGLTWSKAAPDSTLIEPICQASLIRAAGAPPAGRDVLLFSNPASKKREKMTVRISEDAGQTWSAGKVLHDGPAAYSCLVALPDDEAGCLYERGDRNSYERITFARFGLDWLRR